MDSLSVRKKTHTSKLFRPRATSVGCLQLSQGKFGSICHKMSFQRRQKSLSSSSRNSLNEADMTEIQKAKLHQPNIQQKSCGQEATSPDIPDYPVIIENGEIDLLAEYFDCFVNVKQKISALAESMYI